MTNDQKAILALTADNEALRQAKEADFEVYHAVYMTLLNAGTDPYLGALEQAQAIIAERDVLRSRLAEAERNEETLLGMIRHQRDVLRECLPYINESMAGRRPGRCADDIRAAVKALTADSGDDSNESK